MGRKKRAIYHKTLRQQAYEKLKGMQAFGESKKEAKKTGNLQGKIFSFNTYKTYWKHIKYFLVFMRTAHPECTTLRKARKYVREWTKLREAQGLSAWTIHTEAKSVGKLFGIQPGDPDYYPPPARRRFAIKRSRGEPNKDKNFSEENNWELVCFCKGTGLRRSELEDIKGHDLVTREKIKRNIEKLTSKAELTEEERVRLQILQDTEIFGDRFEYYVYVRKGKGGRRRLSPIIGPYTENIVAKFREVSADENVWTYVNSNADIHRYRSAYATSMYRAFARKIEDIPYDKVTKGGHRSQSDLYVCRKDEAKRRLDRRAMLVCSKALGHNRINIVADNYIRGL